MGSVSPVFPESIDDVLTAVQETPRGRWFLEAYANRLKNDGTANILAAISKLENNLNAMNIGGADSAALQNARSAIAAAKREIALLEPETAQLSAEGQMFAKLAELSRQAFAAAPATSSISSGVDRIFKLVTELDQNLAVNQASSASIATPKPAIQYFKQDEAVFEPAPAPVLAVVAKPAAVTEVANRGAKLVIHRVSAAKPETITQAAPPEPSVEEVANVEPVAIISSPVFEQKPEEPSRIVIIRRKADDVIDVPLFGEPEAAHESVSAA
jgi:hypothetical protein